MLLCFVGMWSEEEEECRSGGCIFFSFKKD